MQLLFGLLKLFDEVVDLFKVFGDVVFDCCDGFETVDLLLHLEVLFGKGFDGVFLFVEQSGVIHDALSAFAIAD